MKKILFLLLNIIFTFSVHSQKTIENNSEVIDQAIEKITPAIEDFFSNCLVTTPCET